MGDNSIALSLAWWCGHIAWFLLGPLFTALVYAFASTELPQQTLIYCADIPWVKFDVRDKCLVYTAERMVCPTTLSTALPPTISLVLNAWTHVGVMVLAMGSIHLFLAILLISLCDSTFLLTGLSYVCLMSVFSMVATTPYQTSDLSSSWLHWIIATTLLISTFGSTWVMLKYKLKWRFPRRNMRLQVLLSLSTLGMLISGVLVVQNPNDEMSNGVLAIFEQAYLNIYAFQMLLLIRLYVHDAYHSQSDILTDNASKGIRSWAFSL
jgi:hypothetical protein